MTTSLPLAPLAEPAAPLAALLPPPPRDPLAPHAPARLAAFSARERRILLALARAAIPAGARTPAAGEETVDRLDRVLAAAPRLVLLFFRVALRAVEWLPVLRFGARFSRLDAGRAARTLEAWAHHPVATVRLAFKGLVSPLKMAHYSEYAVARAIGYDPPPETLATNPPHRAPPRRPVPRGRLGALRCEVAIIGSGAGGAVVAKELAERGRDVVVLEEGEYYDRTRFNRRPLEMTALLYRDLGTTTALGRVGIPVPLSRCVGGTTTINSGTCFRIPEEALARFRAAGDLSLTAEELRPHYERVEKFIDVTAVPEELLGENARLVAAGARTLGLHPAPLLRNFRNCRGSGVCVAGCPTDAKRSANVTWIPAALAAGARLVTGAQALRVGASGRARTITAVRDGAPFEITADAVVVAGGTLCTPLLLEQSGVVHPALGRNISLHPATKVAALFDHEVRAWEGVPQGLGILDLLHDGLTFEGIALPPDMGSLGINFVGKQLAETMDNYARLSTFGVMVEDASVGRVRAGPWGSLLLTYQLGAAEVARLQRGIELLCKIYLAAGARELYSPIEGFGVLRGADDVARLARAKVSAQQFELMAVHPLGSCRASRDPARGPVDEQLELHDLQRVFVVDGSVLPGSLGVNPQLTIMALAERASAHIDARLAGGPRA